MSSISLSFDRPWVFFALIPALALILFPYFRLPAVRRKSFKRIAPVVIHCVIATLLIILLAGSTLVKTSYNQQVMILLDLSDSTKYVQDTIKEKADELKELLDDKATVGMMAFADNTVYELSLNSTDQLELKKLDTDATDLAAALNAAASAMDSDKAARIIVLSDGKQTKNDASATAFLLNNSGIRIDAMYFDTTNQGEPEVQISSIKSTEGAYVGDEITISVEITSNISTSAMLYFYDNDVQHSSLELSLVEGTNAVSFSFIVTSSGTHTFHLDLMTGNDTIVENNEAYAYADIAGKASVLIICDRLAEATSMVSVLEEFCDVTTVTSQNAPSTIIQLCNYDEVVLLNVDNKDLPSGFSGIIETYVKDYGRSLFTVGGKNTLMYGNMKGTEFDDLLPVEMTLTESGEGNSVAIMLIIDSSSSMVNGTGGGWGAVSTSSNYMTLAKQGAIKCIESLSDADYAGVISFNTSATLEKALTSTTEANKAVLSRTISSISTNRGTQYNRALQLAYEELDSCDADVKYVMFLSDGNPQDSGYLATVQKMAADGITVSTIGIGGTYSALKTMAEYGNGRYYAVTNASDLPNIMLSETEQVTVSSYITGNFKVITTASNAVTENIDQDFIPNLTGYLGTTLKDEATAYLSTEDGKPIYAQWQYGSGISAVFTSDLSGTWSAEWYESTTGKYLIEKLIETTVDTSHHDSSLDITYTRYGDTVKVSIATTGEGEKGTMDFSVTDMDGNTTISTLSLTASGNYEGSFELDGAGVYATIASWSDDSGELQDFLTSAYAALYSSEYNAFAVSGESMLKSIVSYSGGKVTNDIAYLTTVKSSGSSTVTDPFIILSIMALLLFLIDVAIRKIRWRDIINNLKALTSAN